MIGSLESPAERSTRDRRATRRYPIVASLVYKAFRGGELVVEGVGRTINIGSRGLLFHTDSPLEPNLRLQLSVTWPVLHQMRSPVQLQALGQVVRVSEGQAAVRLVRPELQKREPEAE